MRTLLLLTFILPLFSGAQPLQYAGILADVQSLYTEVARASLQTFKIQILPVESSEVASADSDGLRNLVSISPKLLANPKLTEDALRIILCHEVGHIFGGSPRRNVPFEWTGPTAKDGLSFTSAEGQADYYATAACFKRLVEGQNQPQMIKEIEVQPSIKKVCDLNWKKQSEDSLICQRAITAAKIFLNLHRDFYIEVDKPDNTPAVAVVTDAYPTHQCRLDTFVRGAICRSNLKLKLDFSDSSKNDCENPEAKRPSCWYK